MRGSPSRNTFSFCPIRSTVFATSSRSASVCTPTGRECGIRGRRARRATRTFSSRTVPLWRVGGAASPIGATKWQCCIHPWMRSDVTVERTTPRAFLEAIEVENASARYWAWIAPEWRETGPLQLCWVNRLANSIPACAWLRSSALSSKISSGQVDSFTAASNRSSTRRWLDHRRI